MKYKISFILAGVLTIGGNLFAKVRVNLDLGIESNSNIHSLPSERVPGLGVSNIDEDVRSLKFSSSLKTKSIKVGSIVLKPQTSLEFNYLIDSSLGDLGSSLVNDYSANRNLQSLSVSQVLTAIKRVSKNAAAYLNLDLSFKDGYFLDYHFFDFDYHILRNKRFVYQGELGLQARLSKKLRLDARYVLSISDYKFNYSAYDFNNGRSNDNLNHFLNTQLTFKLNKSLKLILDTKIGEIFYKDKLALDVTGFELTSGLVEQEELADCQAEVQVDAKLGKKLTIKPSLGFLKRVDKVSGARDRTGILAGLSSTLSLSNGLKSTFNYNYSTKDYDSRLAAFFVTPGGEKLESKTQTMRLAIEKKYKNKVKLKLYGAFKKVDSNRNYDRIKNETYGISLNKAF